VNAFSVEQVVDFHTRIFKYEVAHLDQTLLDKGKYNCISVHCINNGLADHEEQLLVFDKNLPLLIQSHRNKKSDI
jgi:hypothetical protein